MPASAAYAGVARSRDKAIKLNARFMLPMMRRPTAGSNDAETGNYVTDRTDYLNGIGPPLLEAYRVRPNPWPAPT